VAIVGLSGNSSVGFESSLIEVDATTTLLGGFFVSVFQLTSMVGWMVGASARRFLSHGLSTPFNLPPAFESSDGRNLRLGASL